MTDALYLLTVAVPDGYDGPVLDAPALMAAALDIINGGEDDVPVRGVACERIDAPPVRPEHSDGAMLARVRRLFDDCGEPDDSEYYTGWHDALTAALGEEDR